ncbi:MAG: VOC family protein [Fimbriimonadaceae bacterium]|nr:VOC family protein [Fimbriimonadaceae bacterium]QYK55146.1 MAG: VOC family protein [Fimbriimonadaceae bacterium]
MDEFITAVGKTFVWHEVYTPNVEATTQFYSALFGWEPTQMDMPDGAYTMMKSHGQGVCGVFDTANTQGASPHWAVYMAVDNHDAKVAECEELGGKMVHGPIDVPTVGRMSLVSDPHGAMFWIFQPEPQS